MQDKEIDGEAAASAPRSVHFPVGIEHQALEEDDDEVARGVQDDNRDRYDPDEVPEPLVRSARSSHPLDEDLSHATPESESIWSRPEHKIATFVLLLIDEFLIAYQLEKTARTLTEELSAQKLALSSNSSVDLWCEMIHSCRAALARKTASSSSTMEKLVEFCAGGAASTRKNFALELMRNPVSVCVSPKRASGSKKGSAAFSLMDAHVQTLRSPVKTKKKRKHTSAASPLRHHHPESYYYQVDKPHSNGHFGSTQANVAVHTSFESRTRTPGSYIEPALVLAHEAQLKRELSSVRILERELRHIRLEKIAAEPKKALAKRLGFASLSKAEIQQQREKQDPYLNALVMEKLGFSKRAECALCQFEFLQVNLPHKVSFKCIMDVYTEWRYDPPDRAYATKYCAPLCYDSVNVCRMCAQIVFQHTATSEGVAAGSEEYGGSRSSTHQQHASARRAKHDSRDESFCSDPYALPPLFADDCYDEHDAASRYEDAVHDEHRYAPLVESPAKAIVYANQSNELGHFMTSKEWEVINPERSFIRQAIESTVKKSS